MVICSKKQKRCLPYELEVGDCWVHISLASDSGLIIAARVGKRTDEVSEELIVATQAKTSCNNWATDYWRAYQRLLDEHIKHDIGKEGTQRLERTNGTLRHQVGRWQRRQYKFSKLWQMTKEAAILAVSYFNWIWQHSRLKTTAAQRAGLTDRAWSWHDFFSYPTLI